MAILTVSTVMNASVVYKYSKLNQLESEEFKNKYGTLTEGLNLRTTAGKYWNVITLMRWNVLSVVLVVLRDHFEMQIIALLVMSVVTQVIIIRGRPMEDTGEHRMSIFNEIMVTLYLYLLVSLTDYNGENPLREQCGVVLLGVVLSAIGVNLLVFLF